jgi:hypothetical protein
MLPPGIAPFHSGRSRVERYVRIIDGGHIPIAATVLRTENSTVELVRLRCPWS